MSDQESRYGNEFPMILESLKDINKKADRLNTTVECVKKDIHGLSTDVAVVKVKVDHNAIIAQNVAKDHRTIVTYTLGTLVTVVISVLGYVGHLYISGQI